MVLTGLYAHPEPGLLYITRGTNSKIVSSFAVAYRTPEDGSLISHIRALVSLSFNAAALSI